jgi:hypothetical protein
MKSPRTAFVLALTIFFVALGAYVALRSLVASASARVVEINKETDAKNAQAEHLASVRERLLELSGVEQQVHAYFVADTAVVPFINELQARGSAVGAAVEISSVAASPTDKSGHSTLKIALSAGGPFDAVMRALGSIEYAPYDITLVNLSLIGDSAKSAWGANATFTVGSVKGGGAVPVPQAAPPAPIASTTPAATSTHPKKP